MADSKDNVGFIVVDDNGALFGALRSNTREILHMFSADLPKNNERGGQSFLSFARLQMKKRQEYLRKTAELATQFYIDPSISQPNVSGLILAGSADFKIQLGQSNMFDDRLGAKILDVVYLSHGGENGFNEAIELSSEIRKYSAFNQSQKVQCF